MARTKAALPAGSRITDYISLRVIAKFVPLTPARTPTGSPSFILYGLSNGAWRPTLIGLSPAASNAK